MLFFLDNYNPIFYHEYIKMFRSKKMKILKKVSNLFYILCLSVYLLSLALTKFHSVYDYYNSCYQELPLTHIVHLLW